MIEANLEVIEWLLDGDIAIQFQTHRDLLGTERPDLRAKIATQGWGKRYLDCRNPDGSWGREFYFPKWTSSHYTLLELKNLAIDPANTLIRNSISDILAGYKVNDGGIGCSRRAKTSDVCVNGMFLNYACYFGAPEHDLRSIVDFLLREHMADGGFNCCSNRSGARHSSLHSTLSVLEGIHEYSSRGYSYRLSALKDAARQSREFILLHRLYKSDHTGEVISKRFLTFPYPPRWFYNILKAMDYFQNADVDYDPRMDDALDEIQRKSGKNGRWRRVAGHPGQVHFQLEPPGWGRWNTLQALRVLKKYRPAD